jgi:hypothetical protein
MGSLFSSTASKVTGLPGIGGKGGGGEPAKAKVLPVLLNTSELRAKQRQAGMANTIVSDTLGGSSDAVV